MNQRQLQQMQQAAQKMQMQVEKMQEELANTFVEGRAQGDAVVVTMNGQREVMAVKISPDIVDPNDVEMLEDLILVAMKDASQKAQEMAETRMRAIMPAGVPGLF